MIYATSDLHIGHKNVLKHDNRPFKNIEEHDNTLISNWNSLISDKDTVYVLGDFFWYKDEYLIDRVLQRLNGAIHIVLGNHDTKLEKEPIRKRFESISPLKVIKIDKQTHLTLCHYQMATWYKSHYPGSYHLFGHSHGNMKPLSKKALDVGIMTNSYFPYSLDKIMKIFLSND
jgi:calcineurin-like phosphoesterase family protein